MSLLNLIAKLTLDTSQYEGALGGAENSASSFGKKFGGAVGKVASLSVKAFTAATAAVGAFGVASVKTGLDFDKSMSQVAATMGMTMDEMENKVGEVDLAWGHFSGNLRDYAQEMGANTAFSAKQAADALNYMALAGYDAQTSMEMLPNVMNLAAAGNMDLARASDMVTDTQTAFGISLERTSLMVDEMAKAASTGNTSVEQLGDAFLVVGGLAKELNGGLVTLADGTKEPVDGIQEMEIALTAMANAGVKGSEAGTHMRNMIMKLSSPTKEGVKQMEALGVKVFDTEGNMRSLQDIMGDLNGALGNLTQEQKIQAISDLFNARDLASAEALLGAVEQDWNKIGESILDAEGAAQKMADTQLDNLAGDITLFKSALEGAQIAVSDGLSPSLRDFVKSGTEGLTAFTNKLRGGDLSGAISAVGESIGKIAAEAIKHVPEMINAGIMLMQGIGEGISGALSGAFTQFDLTSMVLPLMVSLSGQIRENAGELISSGISIIESLAQGMTEGASWFTTPIQTVFTNVVGIITDNAPIIFEAVLGLITNLGASIGSAIPSFLSNTALPMLLQFSETLRSGAGSLVDVGIGFILNIAQGIMDSLPDLIAQLPQIVINIAGVINDNAPKLLLAGIQLIVMIGKGIIQAIPALIENFPKIFEAILAVWSAFNWVNIGKTAVNFIKNGFNMLKTQIPNTLKNIGQNAMNFFKNINWATAGSDAINAILNAINGLIASIPNKLLEIGNSALSAFKDIDWYSVGSNVISGIVTGISSGAGEIINAAKNAAKNAFEAAKNFLGIKSPSRKFRYEVGQMIPKGMALGVEDASDEVSKAVNRLNTDMFRGLENTVDYSPNFEFVNRQSKGSEGKVVNVTNNITVAGAESPEDYAYRLAQAIELELRTA